ncbi:MAG: protein phosphatase 2C domain-containing protein [Gemmataceae bacterium]|nr:protein phosphatase 2C domain-containing protein [Gemmataceae bacterium]
MINFDSFTHFALTDVGIRRSHNQDAFAAIPAKSREIWREQGHIFLVADGMGGHAVGEKASQQAARDIPLAYQKYSKDGVAQALRRAFVEVNAAIHAVGVRNREFQGLGTTATALVLRPEGAWIAHVGDSRVYRVRGGRIQQLTFDHSYLWEMARRQNVDPAELQGLKSNVIIRSLGPDALVQVDIEGPHALEAGDVFVVCSDGLSGPVTDSEIGAVASALPPEEAVRFLVQLANLRGGPDNITAVVVRVGGEPLRTPPRRSLAESLRRMHWSLPGLILGILLAIVAIPAFLSSRNLGLFMFLAATLTIALSLAGLLLHVRAERIRREVEEEVGELHIYRESPCDIDAAVVEKLARSIGDLKQKVSEVFPKLIPESYTKLFTQAEKLQKEGDLMAAFREYCRAMHELARSYNSVRSKAEMFQPVWEKKKK